MWFLFSYLVLPKVLIGAYAKLLLMLIQLTWHMMNPITLVIVFTICSSTLCKFKSSMKTFFLVALVFVLITSDHYCINVMCCLASPSISLLWSYCVLAMVMVVLVYIVIKQFMNLGSKLHLLDV
jgi:hypothetical protein